MAKIGYHVTFKHLLSSINELGLIPNIPEDYGDSGDDCGVYLFSTKQDAINALYGWLGERIEEVEEETNIIHEEVVIKIDVSKLKHIDNTHFFPEYVVTQIIPTKHFISINPI